MRKTAAHRYAPEYLLESGVPIITYIDQAKRRAYVCEEYVLFLEAWIERLTEEENHG